MAKEAKDASKAEAKVALLAEKEYKAEITDLTTTTPLKLGDLDDKVFALLDALQAKGKAKDAIAQLKTTYAEMSRDRISNWRGYSYTLLKKFDEETYKALKETDGRRRPRGGERSERGERGERGERRERKEGEESDRKDKETRDKERQEKKEAKQRGNFPVKAFDFNPSAPAFVPKPLNSDAPAFVPKAADDKDEKKEEKEVEKKDQKEGETKA